MKQPITSIIPKRQQLWIALLAICFFGNYTPLTGQAELWCSVAPEKMISTDYQRAAGPSDFDRKLYELSVDRRMKTTSTAFVFATDCVNNGVVEVYAGTPGVSGDVNGVRSSATFANPFRLAIDASDNLYVAEYTAHVIRKIDASGNVTTLAGTSGESGYVDATGAAARFNRARGLGVDAAGNVYVADMLNRLVRKVTPAGDVTTLAGTQGVSGYADGIGTAAQFANVSNIAVGPAGNLYVSEWNNHAIRKIDPVTAEVTTFVGSGTISGSANGTGGDARFNSPQGLAFDAAGNLYVADWRNYLIRKVTPAGVVTTIAGNGTAGNADGTGAAASFRWPYDISIDSNGDLIVADWQSVRKVTPAGEVTTIVPESAGFNGITGIAVDSYDNIYFTPNGNQAVYRIGDCPNESGQLSILRGSPTSESTNATDVTFQVVFAEEVQNVDVTDFALTGTGGGTLGTPTVSGGDAAVYDVPVTGLTANTGTVGLEIVAGNDIQNLATDPLGAAPSYGAQQTYTLDKNAPTVIITSTESPITENSPIPITVTFDEEVTGFDFSDPVVSNGSVSNFNATGNPVFTFDVTPVNIGDVTVDINAAAAFDLGGNGNTAATTFSIEYDPPVFPGAALNFDGYTSNATVVVPDDASLDLTTEMTIEFWCRPESMPSGWNVFLLKANPGSWTNGYGVWTLGNQLYFQPVGYSNSHATGYSITPGQWIHVAATYDGTTSIVYVDGVEISTKTYASVPIPVNDLPLGIGCDQGSFYRYDGELDELRIWNRVLSPAEIMANKDCEIDGASVGLVANYHFNQGLAGFDNTTPPVNVLEDDSGLDNDGAMTNFALTGTLANWVEPGGVVSGTICSVVPIPEMAVLGGSLLLNIADGDATPTFGDGTDLGFVPVNDFEERTYKIRNNGTATLDLTGSPIVELIDNASGFFSIVTQPTGTSIPTGGSDLEFTVRYLPTAGGPHTATVSIANNDSDENPYTFVVAGTGGTATDGAALAFNNSSQVVTVPDAPSLDITSEISIEFWCKMESHSYYDVFVKKGSNGGWSGGYIISGRNGILDFDPTGWSSSTSTDFEIPLNEWTHIAATYDGSTSKVYVNGSLYSSIAQSGSIPVNNFNLNIGGDLGYSTYSLDGQLDEVRIWNRALTEAEVQANLNCEIAGGATGLVANYHFNEGIAGFDNSIPAVDMLPDDSGSGNDGTLRNFILTGTDANWVAPGGVASDVACSTNPSPEIDLAGGTGPTSIANGDSSPSGTDGTNFGTKEVNTITDQTFTIRNIGDVILNLTGTPIVELIDDNRGFFSVATQPAANTIASGGGNQTFTIRYQPTLLGNDTATVQIPHDDADEAPYTFKIVGSSANIEPGAALAFDNRNSEFVTVPDAPSLDITSAITIEFWINLDSYTGYDAYVMKANAGSWRNGYGLVSSGSGQQLYFIPQGWTNIHYTNYTLPLDTWTHVAGTYDGATSKVYVNGELISTRSMTGPIPTNDNPLGIGGDVGVSFYGTDGQMDEVRIWNRALSQGEIMANMDCEIPTTGFGLVANYHFNQGIAGFDNTVPLVNTLVDDSGEGNDGALNNFLLTGTESNWVTPGGVVSGTACDIATNPEMDVLGGSPLVTIVNGDNSASTSDGTNFGLQPLSTTTTQTYTIRNYGAVALDLPGTPIVDINNNSGSFFSVATQPTGSSIAGNGGELTFEISYTPGAVGSHSATVSISNSDTDENPYTFTVAGISDPDAFVTTWEITGTTEAERTIFIPTTGGGYAYDVEWGDGTGDISQSGDANHVYTSPGVYTVVITGDFPQFYLNGNYYTPFQNHLKLRSIEQWGTGQWRSMARAFYGARNLELKAADAPDLSAVTDCQWMFYFTRNLGSPDLTAWDVTMVNNLDGMFYYSTFDGDVSNWNVSNVTTARYLFAGSQFAGDLTLWSLTNLEDMSYMFASSQFNEDITGWFASSSNVQKMIGTFRYNSAFDQPIGGWTVSSATDMSFMFDGATAFDQPLNGWNVSNVTNFSSMFRQATAFDQPLDIWVVDAAVDMMDMFAFATNFNQDLSNWNTANVTNMRGIFHGASSFDQDLSGLEVTGLAPGLSLFSALSGSGLSTANYDATLVGWSGQSVQSGVLVGAHGLQYCGGREERNQLKAVNGWNFLGDVLDATLCADLPFVTTWTTTTGTDPNITIYTDPAYTYNYNVDWGDGNSDPGQTGDMSHTYSTDGPHTVTITGTFPRFVAAGIALTDPDNALQLQSVEEWGLIEWESMAGAFALAENLQINAFDVPDLSQVTSMANMFNTAKSVNANLNSWNVSKVQDFSFAFANAESFNGDISRWDVSAATTMQSMFEEAILFDRDLSSWIVSQVTNMAAMFKGAMAFNQNIGNWDVRKVERMVSLFEGASSFDQDLGDWELVGLLPGNDGGRAMLSLSGMSKASYDATLIGWAAQISELPNGLEIGADPLKYCAGAVARMDLIVLKTWTFIGDVEECPLPLVGEEDSSAGNIAAGGEWLETNLQAVKPAMKVYPNPARDQVTITFQDPDLTYQALEIYDQLGQRVWSRPGTELQGIVELVLDRQTFAPGMYLVILRLEDNVLTEKLVIVK